MGNNRTAAAGLRPRVFLLLCALQPQEAGRKRATTPQPAEQKTHVELVVRMGMCACDRATLPKIRELRQRGRMISSDQILHRTKAALCLTPSRSMHPEYMRAQATPLLSHACMHRMTYSVAAPVS